MPSQTLTEQFIVTLDERRPDEKTIKYFDTEVKGFMLEHRATGKATYYFRYRNFDKKIATCHIGKHTEISLADARTEAYQMRQLLKDGGDPATERNRFRKPPKLSEFAETRYLPYAKAHKRSWRNDELMLRLRILPVFGERRIDRITRAEITEFQHGLISSGYAGSTCNRTINLMKTIFNAAMRWDVLPPGTNPCSGIRLFTEASGCERYLTQSELARLFQILEDNRNKMVCQIIRLLILTGARKREILDLRWSEVNLVNKTISIPPHRSKSMKLHVIPLSDVAADIIASQPKDPELPWVFFNPKTRRPIVCFYAAWDGIRQRAGIRDVRVHDLRHSYASFLVNAGRSLYEVQKLLGHHSPKITMRYAHLSPGALRDATSVVGDLVKSINDSAA